VKLPDAISKHTCKIGVVGLGHVGLAVAATFADRGFAVSGCDLIRGLVQNISSGNLKLFELELAEMINNAVKSGKFSATTDCLNVAKTCEITIICVQTPISRKKQPDLSFLRSACETVGNGLRYENLVLIMSSVPPGTTTEMARTLEKVSGLSCGKDFWLACCPERLAPGNSVRDFINNDRMIGGFDAQSAKLANRLFHEVVRGKVFLTDSLTAEIAKLAENTFRDVNIAFANELALICEQDGVDVQEVIKLANTHPRVNIHGPGCGVGGPCLPKKPYLLLAGAKRHTKHSMIRCSRRLNSFMESHTISKVLTALGIAKKNVSRSRISVLGVSYKKGSDDVTNAPSKFIVQKLLSLGAKVNIYDPFCVEAFGGKKCEGPYEAIAKTDCLLILTDHKEFGSLDLKRVKEIMNKPACIVGGRRVISPAEAASVGIMYFGIGLGKKVTRTRSKD